MRPQPLPSQMTYPSFLLFGVLAGGSSDHGASNIAVESLAEAFVIGNATSTDFPIANATEATNTSGGWDAFVAGIQAGGKGLICSTQLGARGETSSQGLGLAARSGG